jgi:dTDP-4-dehydrorhamnose reductase
MKIAVIGSSGQLARLFRQYGTERISFFGKEKINLLNEDALYFLVGFDIIINCAAYTQVDRAEEFPEEAFLLNRTALIKLIRFCELRNIAIIHFSTDYVFDGGALLPYCEQDHTNPLSIYGISKLAGEELLLQARTRALIIRTSWIYSEFGNNFCKKILDLRKADSAIRVVNDQISSPTSGRDLVLAVMRIIAIGLPPEPEIIHIANLGECSRFDFAKMVLNLTVSDTNIIAIKSSDLSKTANRPKYSTLSTTKLLFKYGISMPTWEKSLEHTISDIIKKSPLR